MNFKIFLWNFKVMFCFSVRVFNLFNFIEIMCLKSFKLSMLNGMIVLILDCNLGVKSFLMVLLYLVFLVLKNFSVFLFLFFIFEVIISIICLKFV